MTELLHYIQWCFHNNTLAYWKQFCWHKFTHTQFFWSDQVRSVYKYNLSGTAATVLFMGWMPFL